jgi:hypothetical protein
MTRDEMIITLIHQKLVTVDTASGRVFRHRGPGGITLKTPREVPGSNVNGYLGATFKLNGERRQIRLHRMVWVAAHGPIPDGLVIAHLNNDKQDNRVENLALTTADGNSAMAAMDGLYRPRFKLTPEQTQEIAREYATGKHSLRSLASKYGIGKSRVQQIVAGQVSRAKYQ